MPDLFIGLMSGTSLDGVDGVLADFEGGRVRVLAHAGAPSIRRCAPNCWPSTTPAAPTNCTAPSSPPTRWCASMRRSWARCWPAAASVPAVTAIGAHGQTVRHRPQQFDGTGYTVQLNQPALLAELTGIDVVADFRTPRRRRRRPGRAAGAVLPPRHVRPRRRGGRRAEPRRHLQPDAAAPDGRQLGFDCGPANALMDHWTQHQGQPFDARGGWAAGGHGGRRAAAGPAGRALLRGCPAQEHRPRPVQSGLAVRASWQLSRALRRRTCRPRWPS
jgi:anhydro-N-acetylmuramic acid kinase